MTNQERLVKFANRLDEPTLARVVGVLLAMEVYPAELFTTADLVAELGCALNELHQHAFREDPDGMRNEAMLIARVALQLAVRCTPTGSASNSTPTPYNPSQKPHGKEA